MPKNKILIVEDSPFIIKFIDTILKKKGYETDAVEDGKSAIEKTRKESFDMVLLDLKLPDMDGIKVLREIKKINPKIPVIMLSAYDREKIQKEIPQGVASGFLPKPFKSGELIEIVEENLKEPKMVGENLRESKPEMEPKGEEIEKVIGELKREIIGIATLLDIGKTLVSIKDPGEQMTLIVKTIMTVMRAKICSLMLVDPETKMLKIKASQGLSKEIIRDTKIKIGEEISGWIAKEGQPLLVEDVEEDPRFKRRNKEKYLTKSLLSAPLRTSEGVIGVLHVNNKISGEIFDYDDLLLLSALGNQIALSIENAQLNAKLSKMAKELAHAKKR